MGATADALRIEIDYSLDTNGFFNRAGARTALRAVCDYYEGNLHDDLARIDRSQWPAGSSWTAVISHPGTGAQQSFPNKVIPADTYILYAGGRGIGSLGFGGPGGYSASGNQPWLDLVAGRGEPGALASPPTDFGPWGGAVTFNSALTWNFSLTSPGDNSLPGFTSIALHEVAHALGFGTADSFSAKVRSGAFAGANVVRSYGRAAPLHTDSSHWRDDGACVFGTGYDASNPLNVLSTTVMQFGTPGGRPQIGLMDPSGCRTGIYLQVATLLDEAALADIGWNVSRGGVAPDPGPTVIPVIAVRFTQGPERAVLSWRTQVGVTYHVESSTGLMQWSEIGQPVTSADGQATFIDATGLPEAKFYRLRIARELGTGVQGTKLDTKGEVRTITRTYPMVGGCSDCGGLR